MKVFKAMLCLIIAMAVPLAANTLSARAESGKRYAIAVSPDIYLCEEMNPDSDCFAIPYSYCVEIKAEYDEWYFVRYARTEGIYTAVDGYCKKTGLIEVDKPPQNTYLYYPLDVVLQPSPQNNSRMPGLEATITVPFYGNYYRDSTKYKCVLYNGGFKYIEGEISDYALNELPTPPSSSKTPSAKLDEGSAKAITAVIIVALAGIAIVVLLVTGKSRKTIK